MQTAFQKFLSSFWANDEEVYRGTLSESVAAVTLTIDKAP